MKQAPVTTGTSPVNGRSVWNGNLSFGLVTIPVRLYVCARARETDLHLWCSAHKSRVMRPTYCSNGGEQFETYADLNRCYEYLTTDGLQHIELTGQELQDIQPESNKTIEILKFAPLNSVEPLWFESSWYVLPDTGWEHKYAVFRLCLAKKKAGALGKYCAHNRENLVLIRALPNGLIMHSLFYQDEVRNMPHTTLPEVSQEEVKLGIRLMRELSGNYVPGEYRDSYADALQELIAYKIVRAQPPKRDKKTARQPSTDLMSELKDSLKEVKKGKKKK